jgi:putative membrane protein
LWYGLFWIWLAIEPVDRRDWLLENLLSLTLVAVLVLTYRRYQFSRLSYGLIALFLTLHAIGAHYTYAEVPFGFWLKDFFILSRNPFDRLAHFAYGALLVYPLRELLVRLAGLRRASSIRRTIWPRAA